MGKDEIVNSGHQKGGMSDNGLGQGMVFGIQHFSIHDGCGIRSNVFLKGCPMQCLWCHNPEGLSPLPEVWYYANRCVGCGACGHIYRNMGSLAGQTPESKEQYVERCAYKALELTGRHMTAAQVMDEVVKDRIFFNASGGGLTITGGEPMLQTDFTYGLLKSAKMRGISTAIETGGYADRECYRRILPLVDEFLWDYKETDEQKHRDFTGVGNKEILGNLRFVYDQGIPVTLRCPIIPGLNDTEEHLQGIASISRELKGLKGVELMPYHSMGIAKGGRMGAIHQTEYRVPSREERKQWEQQIIHMGGRIF